LSLIGIDMGSSSVKIAAYSEDGKLLAVVNNEINPLHPQPGWWETDPEDVWRATTIGLGQLMNLDKIRHDPPKALAISASGRENFPMDDGGHPLGNNMMGADIRGEEFEIPPKGAPIPEKWTLSCGHLRERMDPVLRLMWWRKYHPEIIAKARYYPDWHGFLTFRLCGRNVSERSLVGRWLVYDIRSKTWSPERLAEYQIEAHLLPEVLKWGEVIDIINPLTAEKLGLPKDLKVIVGGHDMNCAGIGAGASCLGSACLISGSYENVLIPTVAYPTASMLLRGLSVTPHLGKIERSIYAICPTGNAVLNWARDITKVPINELADQLKGKSADPSPVMALPYLSGAMLFWQGGRKLRGALMGLTLATKPIDIIQAFMESIAYDHVNTFSLLEEEKVKVDHIRAVGGGTRSEWWTQLKADMVKTPIEVSAQSEPGTFGAALIAGIGMGVFNDLDEISQKYSGTSRVYEPNSNRADLHKEKLETYRRTVPVFLTEVYKHWD
jgi:xylulokinase